MASNMTSDIQMCKIYFYVQCSGKSTTKCLSHKRYVMFLYGTDEICPL